MRRSLWLFVVYLSALSQAPPPGPVKPSNDHKNDGRTAQPGTPPDKNQTQPISSAIEKLTSELKAWKEEYKRASQQPASTAEYWSKIGTICSGIAAVAGIVLLGVQTVIISKQREELKRQRAIMEKQAALLESQIALYHPRVHVDSVRAEGFIADQSPAFFVRFFNSGITAAQDVTITIRVDFDKEWDEPVEKQKISIPAQDSRELFVRSTMVFSKEMFAALNNGDKILRISGTFGHGDDTQLYCYKYLRWPHAPRPYSLPQFVPCDFNTAMNVVVSINL